MLNDTFLLLGQIGLIDPSMVIIGPLWLGIDPLKFMGVSIFCPIPLTTYTHTPAVYEHSFLKMNLKHDNRKGNGRIVS